MQIIINEDEILEAIKDYVGKQGIVTAGKEIKVDLIAGRGANGTRAEIDLVNSEEAAAVNKALASKGEKEVTKATEKVNQIVDEAAKEDPKKKPRKKAEPKKEPAPKEVPEPDPPEESSEKAETGAAPSGDSLFNF